MADSTEREVYLLILRGIRTRQCCLEIWTIPLKIFNPFISRQLHISPSRPNRGMKGLGWLDASCAAILTSESWIEDTKYCQIIAPPFGNSFVQFLYRSCMELFTFWIILTFHLHRMTVCFLTRFSYLPSFLRWSPSSPTTYRCWLSPLRCNGVGDDNNSSKVTTLHENTSAIFDTVSSSLFLRDGCWITVRRASMSVISRQYHLLQLVGDAEHLRLSSKDVEFNSGKKWSSLEFLAHKVFHFYRTQVYLWSNLWVRVSVTK